MSDDVGREIVTIGVVYSAHKTIPDDTVGVVFDADEDYLYVEFNVEEERVEWRFLWGDEGLEWEWL